MGDVNCDGRVNAADLVELSELIPTGSFGSCHAGDVNQDGVVNELDQSALMQEIFS